MKPQLHEDWIDPYAHKIVKNLQEAGFETYLVGGCVRDLLVGLHPKDFDIATNASPQQVRKKIANAYIIGRRFRLVLVKRGDVQYEVATFRRSITAEELADEDQTIEGDNFFGTAEQDAMRRDFTVNGLFYDPVKHKLHDFCDGKKDIEARVLRIIGNPKERLIEDPIRILRAIRLSHKINFALEPGLRAAMLECCHELKKSALPRRREEYIKFLRLRESALALMEIYDLGVMKEILPGLESIYSDPAKFDIFDAHLSRIRDVEINKKDPGELFAALLFSFFKAKFGEESWNQEQIEADADVLHFMRDEIGIFKQEAGFFWKALDIIPGLHRIDLYSRKGERRKSAYVKNEAFGLALKLAQLDFSLSPQELYFWAQELERYSHLPSESFDQEIEAEHA